MFKIDEPLPLGLHRLPMIIVDRVSKTFQGNPVLKDVSLTVPQGSLSVIIGRSGCGKSTLLRLLNGLEPMDSGSIQIGNFALTPTNVNKIRSQIRGKVGMVFQNYQLFPHLTLIENLILAPRVVKGEAEESVRARAESLLEKVGLSNERDRYPSQISGGQSQRAAIARALAMQPEVLLYDEPTSALDPWLVDEVFQVMKALNAEGLTQVVVTHEMGFAREVADEIIHISEGRVLERGEPNQMFKSPLEAETRQFLQKFLSQ